MYLQIELPLKLYSSVKLYTYLIKISRTLPLHLFSMLFSTTESKLCNLFYCPNSSILHKAYNAIYYGLVSRKRAEASFFILLDDKEAEFLGYHARNANGYSLITFCACLGLISTIMG